MVPVNDTPDFDLLGDLLRAKRDMEFAAEAAAHAAEAMRAAENRRFEALGRYSEALRKWQESNA